LHPSRVGKRLRDLNGILALAVLSATSWFREGAHCCKRALQSSEDKRVSNDHVAINKAVWDADAPNWVAAGERLWAAESPEWGSWGAPETSLGLLPEDMSAMRAVELGCGAGYVSAWMTRRGAEVTGIDISPEQLATARRLAEKHGVDIAFIEGDAEATGLPDAAFDFAISEYGAALWRRPATWLREAWRLLRPGGGLAFLGSHPLTLLCAPLTGAPCDRALSTSRSLASICPPAATCTAFTTASRSAWMPVSIFIASMVSSRSPWLHLLAIAHRDRGHDAGHRRADMVGVAGLGLGALDLTCRRSCGWARGWCGAGR
jgi:ubiquinone/menaquinone biosynthesis C-methylase UbiE